MLKTKNFKSLIIIGCITNLSVILITHQLLIGLLRHSQADQFITQTRNLLLMGDYRAFDYARLPLIDRDFANIDLCSKIKPTELGFGNIALFSNFSIPISYDSYITQNSKIKENICFIYFRFSQISYMLVFALFISVFIILIGLRFERRYFEDLAKELEHNRNKSIANASKMIAHDLRSPFSLLKMSINLLKNSDPDKFKETVDLVTDTVIAATNSASHLLDDLLNLDGGISLQRKPTNLNPLIISTLEEVKLTHQPIPKSILIHLGQSENFYAQIDGQRFKRVLSNLIINAFQANNGSGELRIYSEAHHKNVLIGIYNSEAKNITDKDLKQLFEPFFTKNKDNGTGIGLAVVQNLISLHGGKIEAYKVGDGIEFRITLPLISE